MNYLPHLNRSTNAGESIETVLIKINLWDSNFGGYRKTTRLKKSDTTFIVISIWPVSSETA